MYRFFEETHLKPGSIILLNHNNSFKIINVLKLKINQELYLFNNTNFEFYAKIKDISSKKVAVEIIKSIKNNLESHLKIHLAQAILKNDNMDFIIQKSTELGVDQITPIISERTIVKPKNYSNKIEHWHTIAIGACCQCGRNLIPNINSIVKFTDFMKIHAQPTLTNETNEALQVNNRKCLKLIMTPYCELNTSTLNSINLDIDCIYEKIFIIIGPEGGLTSGELNIAKQHGFNIISLGPRVLRAETAPIVIISILQAKFGDLLIDRF